MLRLESLPGQENMIILLQFYSLCTGYLLHITSLLLSHHHSTSALVSEILTSVLQTVQKNLKNKTQQFTYGQYIFTDCTEDNVQNAHTYTQYTQCTIKTYLVTNTPIHIIHRMYTSALCPHLCIVICEGATDYNLQ